ncbi:NUDIX hydrolase [Salinicoccus sp. ID82-1]|uniref:NUDIX hydrolase n=1 Tax=Salinicoccus sp. ID82-1 TaxID=2820269 RepID=UPI001F23FA3E|nr:NUDIX hydrolase [Salinicoccus sp. ID82-1]MCG1009063.1 NUDIX hydrolase [Salinicoccus sp. ID82-1]
MNTGNDDYSHLKEEITSSERVFDGKVIKVDNSTVQLPDGGSASREIVYHRGAVSLVAVAGDEMYFVRQYRVATDDFLLEIPAGKIEVGEAPDETAEKELKEEIGGVAESLRKIHGFYVSPGFSNEYVHLYEADNMTIDKQALDDDEFLDIVKIRLSELPAQLDNGAFQDAKTVIGVQYVIAKYNL